MRRFCALVVLSCALLLLWAFPASASTIEIQFSGVDLTYSGGSLFDSGAANTVGRGLPAEADGLTTMTFLVDGVQVGSTLTTNIALDLYIAGLTSIPAGGGAVTTAGNGNGFGVDLLTDSSDPAYGVGMQIDKMSFFYTGYNIAIAVAGQSTSLWTQELPYGLAFDTTQPISIALSSASLRNVTTSGGFVTGFQSSGTGNISGTLVPEPATLLVLAAGGLGLLRRRRA